MPFRTAPERLRRFCAAEFCGDRIAAGQVFRALATAARAVLLPFETLDGLRPGLARMTRIAGGEPRPAYIPARNARPLPGVGLLQRRRPGAVDAAFRSTRASIS